MVGSLSLCIREEPRADDMYGLSVFLCYRAGSAPKDNLLDEYMSSLPSLTAGDDRVHAGE